MIKELVDLINLARPSTDTPIDKERTTIRCLPHVLHLAVTDLMKALKSLAEDDELDVELDPLTEEQAERLHAERRAGEQDEQDKVQLSDTDLGFAILKVSTPAAPSSVSMHTKAVIGRRYRGRRRRHRPVGGAVSPSRI
jgi:hypothetical protein